MPVATSCRRNSGAVSIRTLWVSMPTTIDGRERLSRGSVDVQTRQSQPIMGTPWLVPLPRMVTLSTDAGSPLVPPHDTRHATATPRGPTAILRDLRKDGVAAPTHPPDLL